MSKLFYDNLTVFKDVNMVIKKTASSKEEQEELWVLVDEIISHRVIEKVLDNLPKDNHGEFLELFHKCPHDEVAIYGYLNGKTGKDLKKVLEDELKCLSEEILRELKIK